MEVSVMAPHQLGVASVIQDEVLWLEISVNDPFGMQISESLHHAGCVKACCGVFKRSSVD